MNRPQPAATLHTRLESLATPVLVLDRLVMERNIARYEARAEALGVTLRPHGKTPKSLEIFTRLMRGGGGLTTSTLAETEAALEAGGRDIFYAVALDHRKVARAAGMIRAGGDVSFLIDTLEGARLCAEAARREGVVLPFWIEIDVDGYRSGLPADGADFLGLARFLADHPSTRLRGLMSYAGASYGGDGAVARGAIARLHKDALLAARARLAAEGHQALELSFGSGPAFLDAADLDGISEVRAGIHVFQDLFQAGIGACAVEDIAVSVLASVIGARRDLGRLMIDAGGLALSKDRSTQGRAFDAGFGLVCDPATRQPIGDLIVSAVSQEVGMITSPSGAALPFERLPVGGQVAILPNHADMTAAAYEGYHVVEGDDRVVAYWSRRNFW